MKGCAKKDRLFNGKFQFIEHPSVGADDHIGPKNGWYLGRCGHRPLQSCFNKLLDKLEFNLELSIILSLGHGNVNWA